MSVDHVAEFGDKRGLAERVARVQRATVSDPIGDPLKRGIDPFGRGCHSGHSRIML